MRPRKTSSEAIWIDPIILEDLVVDGYSICQIAKHLHINRDNFYDRIERERELKLAIERGREAPNRKTRVGASVWTN